MLNRFIGFGHLLSGVVLSSLPLIEQSDRSFDIFMLAYSLSPISWMLCKNECLISYFVKKYKHPNYKLGDDPFEYSDITELFHYINLINMVKITYTSITILQTTSLVLVQQLTPTIHPLFFYVPMTLKLTYSCGGMTKRWFPYYEGAVVTSFSLLLYKYFKR